MVSQLGLSSLVSLVLNFLKQESLAPVHNGAETLDHDSIQMRLHLHDLQELIHRGHNLRRCCRAVRSRDETDSESCQSYCWSSYHVMRHTNWKACKDLQGFIAHNLLSIEGMGGKYRLQPCRAIVKTMFQHIWRPYYTFGRKFGWFDASSFHLPENSNSGAGFFYVMRVSWNRNTPNFHPFYWDCPYNNHFGYPQFRKPPHPWWMDSPLRLGFLVLSDGPKRLVNGQLQGLSKRTSAVRCFPGFPGSWDSTWRNMSSVQNPFLIPLYWLIKMSTWIDIIPHMIGSIIPYNHQPTGVLNTAPMRKTWEKPWKRLLTSTPRNLRKNWDMFGWILKIFKAS